MLFLYSPQATRLSPPFSVVATLHQSCYETMGPKPPELSLILACGIPLAQGLLGISPKRVPTVSRSLGAAAHHTGSGGEYGLLGFSTLLLP